tara:strand:+ start:10922 stop:11962 length:1041 start_codon:yes stop_codon:yes gene_type:complete
MIIQKYIKGYQFSSEEAAKEARGKSTKSHSFPSKEADFTIYWQNYDISLGLKPFWYMVDSGGLERSLGEPTEFLVNIIQDLSFNELFSEPISSYSLRNLTSDPEQPVVRVSTGGKEVLEFDLTESQVLTVASEGEYIDLRVVRWYDQAGDDNTLTNIDTGNLPYLVSEGRLVTQNGRPSVKFLTGNSLYNSIKSKPIPDEIRTYNVSSYSDKQSASIFGNNILRDMTSPEGAILTWGAPGMLRSPAYELITQDNTLVASNKGSFIFPKSTSSLRLYDVGNGLTKPMNFVLGGDVEMYVSEFILYPTETNNVKQVTENIIGHYSLATPQIDEEPGDGGIKIPPKGEL